MKKLSGFIAEFDRSDILTNDYRNIRTVHNELVELTVRYGILNHVEIMISGYNNYPRSLYEIPQVQRWITGITHGLGASWTKFMGASTVPIPDWLYWLTPGSLYLCTLSMIPSMHNRLANGKLLIEFDTDKISELCAKSIVAAEDVLKQAGLSDETVEDITEQSAMNMINMLCGEKLGDYVVLYPTDGQIRTYRKRIN